MWGQQCGGLIVSRATTTLHADEIEPLLDMVAKLGDRFSKGS